MDPETAYCRSLLRTLKEEPPQFCERLQRRWEGEEGPALAGARSWSDVLADAYRETPEDQRGPWVDVTLEILQHFDGEQIIALADPEELTGRLHLMGALELAHVLEWPGDRRKRLYELLNQWFRLATARPDFPRPLDLYEKHGLLGQPEVDVLCLMLRLAVRQRLSWNDSAEGLWKLEAMPPELGDRVLAARRWELARWAVASGEDAWLSNHLVTFVKSLERAGWYPGNLSNFFFVAEREYSRERVRWLIGQLARAECLPNGLDAERQVLADRLDYFGDSEPTLRKRLQRAVYDPVRAVDVEKAREWKDYLPSWMLGHAGAGPHSGFGSPTAFR